MLPFYATSLTMEEEDDIRQAIADAPGEPLAKVRRRDDTNIACVLLDGWLTDRLETERKRKKTRPDTRHKMRLVCVLFTFEKKTRDGRADGRTDRRTSYRDATAHLKRKKTERR